MTSQLKSRPSFSGGWKVPDQGSGQCYLKAEGAKNHRKYGLGCHQMLTLATYNGRSLSSDSRLLELEEELLKINWDVVGLSEVRRKGEDLIELQSGHLFYFRGTDTGRTSGVGFIINKKLKNNILEIDSSSDRTARLVLKLTERYQIQIIQAYAPTTSHSDEEIEEFYEEMSHLNNKGKEHLKVIMGDFNARVGKQQQSETSVGCFGHGVRNERGNLLVEFAEAEKFFVMNSFFKKKPQRKWTWRHPNGGTSEIDYIMCNKKYVIEDCGVLNRFNTGSDHRMVRCKVHLNTKLERRKLIRDTKNINMENLKQQNDVFKLELRNRFAALEGFATEEADISETNRSITKVLMETATTVGGTKANNHIKKISEQTKILMQKRREMKVSKASTTSRVEYAELCKTVRKAITEDIRKFNCDMVQKAIEGNLGLKKAKHSLCKGRKQIIALRKEDGTVTRNRKEILRRVEEFYTKLYESEDKTTTVTNTDIGEHTKVPPVLPSEIAYAIKHMKRGKTPGEDGITVDILQEASEVVDNVLAQLFTKCLDEGKIPEDWNNATIILLHKKGDKEDLKNYRPISLLSVLYKIFTKVLSFRLQRTLESAQSREQAGFRTGYSTVDHIQVLKELIERTKEYELPLCMAFIDYEKAFDSVQHSAITQALKSCGIEDAYINIIENIYKNASAKVRLFENTASIKIEKGVRQGDTISPKLFNAALQDIFRTMNWENKGIKINGDNLTHLCFADDVVIFATDPTELQSMIQELADRSKEIGLKMNLQKTKVMYNGFSRKEELEVNGIKVETVNSYTYLGQQIASDGNIEEEINRRIKLGWSAFGRNNMIFKSNLPLCLKRKVFNMCILPVLTYGSETWTLKKKTVMRLQAAQRSMERCMLGITRKDKKRNTWIRKMTGVDDIIIRIKMLKWQWAGHVARRTDQRWTSEVLNWMPRDQKRPRRRPGGRWADEIRKHAGVTWPRLAQNRKLWRRLGETFIQQWIDNG